jgi:hypothetical protein
MAPIMAARRALMCSFCAAAADAASVGNRLITRAVKLGKQKPNTLDAEQHGEE